MSKVIATIGPRTETKESIRELAELGVKLFRLNLSHNFIEWHLKVINNIREVAPTSSILADIPGRKIRTTLNICKEKFNKDQKIYLVSNDFTEGFQKSNFIYEVNNNILFNIAKKGMKIYADDGRLSFDVKSVNDKYITLISKSDGILDESKEQTELFVSTEPNHSSTPRVDKSDPMLQQLLSSKEAEIKFLKEQLEQEKEEGKDMAREL